MAKEQTQQVNTQKIQELISYYQQEKYKTHSSLVVDKTGKLLVDDKGFPMIQVFASGVIEKADDEEGSVVHYISTPHVDHVDDVMNPFGCDDATLQKNKSVFYNHKWNGPRDLPIGRNAWLKKQKDGVLCKTIYAIGVTRDDFAGDVYRLVKSGFLNSYSIGWRPVEWDVIVLKDLVALISTKPASQRFEIPNIKDFSPEYRVMYHDAWTTHEYSQVGIACNEDAVRKQLEKAFEDGLVESDFGKTYFGGLLGERPKLGEVPAVQLSPELQQELVLIKQSNETLHVELGNVKDILGALNKQMEGINEKQEQCLVLLDDEPEVKGEEPPEQTSVQLAEEIVGEQPTTFDASKLINNVASGAIRGKLSNY